jgi:hypothetical protein
LFCTQQENENEQQAKEWQYSQQQLLQKDGALVHLPSDQALMPPNDFS